MISPSLNHCKEMRAEPGRRFLKQPAAKLEPVIVAINLWIRTWRESEISQVRNFTRHRTKTNFVAFGLDSDCNTLHKFMIRTRFGLS